MVLLTPSTVLILTILIKNSFIVFHPPDVIEAFVCFNKENDTWPNAWRRLYPIIQANISTYQTVIVPQNNDSIYHYKIRFVYTNRTYGDSPWRQILNDNTNKVYATNVNNTNFERTITGVIIISVVFATVALITTLIYKLRKMLISVLLRKL